FSGTQDQKAYQDKIAGSQFVEFLRRRLVLMRELLAPNGAIYVHLDQRKSHTMKLMLDEVFGEHGFGKAASSPCLRPGSTLALRGRGFHPALDQGDAHDPLEPQHKVPRPHGRGLNG